MAWEIYNKTKFRSIYCKYYLTCHQLIQIWNPNSIVKSWTTIFGGIQFLLPSLVFSGINVSLPIYNQDKEVGEGAACVDG